MTTKEKLVKDLQQANAPSEMIANAIRGFYDDYESWIATPITRLAYDCENAGLQQIANKARNGDYDGTAEEGQEWFKNNVWEAL